MEARHARPAGELSREISREMVSLVKQYLGRGPTYARTYIHDDLVTVIFQDTMTIAEQTLKDEGNEETVKQLRHVFQGAFRDDAVSIVERLTGRPVLAFLSDHAIEPDYAVEVFVLAEDSSSASAGAARE